MKCRKHRCLMNGLRFPLASREKAQYFLDNADTVWFDIRPYADGAPGDKIYAIGGFEEMEESDMIPIRLQAILGYAVN